MSFFVQVLEVPDEVLALGSQSSLPPSPSACLPPGLRRLPPGVCVYVVSLCQRSV
jgi:hypothetical protein